MAAMAPPDPDNKALSSSSSSEALGPGSEGWVDDERDLVISAGDGSLVSLGSDKLVLELDLGDEEATTSTRICGIEWGASKERLEPQIISLYNVLWAERQDSTLRITHAERHSKHKLRPTITSVPLSPDDDEDDVYLATWIDTLLSRAYGQAKMRKRVKVLVNPHAGPGGSMHKWQHDVEPLFRAAQMTIDMEETTYPGEAVSIARNVNIDDFDTIIACSGDGLPYEIFNGLGERADARNALRKIAVNQIPCGSGNAMACNLCASPHPSEAALAMIKGIDTPMDLVSVTHGNERKLSFLSQSVGIIAEADLGTEHMRWMGAARFSVGVLMRIFKKKSYPCDLAVKVEVDDREAIKAQYKKRMEARQNVKNTTLATQDVSGAVDDTDELGGLPPLRYGTINDELPEEGWEHIKYDNMGNFYCGKMAYVAPDTVFFPASAPDDGLMDLVTIDSDLSIGTQLGLLDSVRDDGDFFTLDCVNYRKISAFRITPREQDDGYISIDGERIPFGPFQAEVHPKLGKVYSLRGRYETSGPKGWKDVA